MNYERAVAAAASSLKLSRRWKMVTWTLVTPLAAQHLSSRIKSGLELRASEALTAGRTAARKFKARVGCVWGVCSHAAWAALEAYSKGLAWQAVMQGLKHTENCNTTVMFGFYLCKLTAGSVSNWSWSRVRAALSQSWVMSPRLFWASHAYLHNFSASSCFSGSQNCWNYLSGVKNPKFVQQKWRKEYHINIH